MDPRELAGEWRLSRLLADRAAHRFGRVNGRLEIAPDGDALRWHESGDFVWDGHVAAITRTSLLAPTGGGWSMRFEDGRPFHDWTPGEFARHGCAEDVYWGLIDVRRDRMRTWWEVIGPHKAQRIITRFVRIA